MRVLGIVASPRALGNSEILVKAMLGSLPEDTEKQMIRLTDLRIEPCNACYACLPKEKGCRHQDDLEFLLQAVREADGVIIASACYFLGPHTSIKTIGDRLLAILANGEEFANKPCVTVLVHGLPKWDGYGREALTSFARFLHLDVVGDMMVEAAMPGAVVREELLAKAANLAQQLLKKNRSVEGSHGVTCGICDSRMLMMQADGGIQCPICGAEGKLKRGEDGFYSDFMTVSSPRFSLSGTQEHGRVLTEIRDTYIRQRKVLAAQRKEYDNGDWWIRPSREK